MTYLLYALALADVKIKTPSALGPLYFHDNQVMKTNRQRTIETDFQDASLREPEDRRSR
jgi:hypothetical protein